MPDRRLGICVVNFGDCGLFSNFMREVALLSTPHMVFCVDQWSGEKNRLSMMTTDVAGRHEILFLNENVGYGAAVNMAARRALDSGCTHLLVSNLDVMGFGRVVDELVTRCDGLVAISPLISLGETKELWFWGARIGKFTGRVVPLNRRRHAADPSRPTYFLSGCFLMMSSDSWTAVGGFSADYFMYWEDVEWSWRATRVGIAMRLAGDLTIAHAVGVTSRERGRVSPTAEYYSARNRWLFISGLTFPGLRRILNLALLPLRIAALMARTLLSSASGEQKRTRITWWLKGTRDGVRSRFDAKGPMGKVVKELTS